MKSRFKEVFLNQDLSGEIPGEVATNVRRDVVIPSDRRPERGIYLYNETGLECHCEGTLNDIQDCLETVENPIKLEGQEAKLALINDIRRYCVNKTIASINIGSADSVEEEEVEEV